MKPQRRLPRWWRRQNAFVKTLCVFGLLLAPGALVLAGVLTLRHFKPSLFPTSTPGVQIVQMPTPVPTWSILPEAASLCEAAFTQAVGQGSPRSYLLYLQSPDYNEEGWVPGLDDKMALFDPPYEAQSPDQVQTLVCVRKTKTCVATYTGPTSGNIPGYRRDWEVRLVTWPAGEVLASESYAGRDPPGGVSVPRGAEVDAVHGDPPGTRDLYDWLAMAVVDDSVLHLEDQMEGLAFSPSGRLLAAGGWHGRVRVWEVASGQEAASWKVAATYDALENVQHIVFSPDGRFLATSASGETKLWDVVTWQEARTFDAGGTTSFSPDGRWLAASGTEGGVDTTTLWDVESGQRGRSFEGSVGAFLPDQMLLTTYRKDGVALWDATTGEEVCFYPRLGRYFSPDGKLSASKGQNGQPILFDMETGEMVHALGDPGSDILCLAFSPDGALLASGRRLDETVTLWDVNTGQKANVLHWHWDHIFGLAFSPDGRLLATGDYDGTIKLWDTGTWR